MPRAGGEADKLGNRYEARWTVKNILEVLSGEAVSLQPESFEEAKGVEFIKMLPDSTQEFHSVKRQRAREGWRLRDLVQEDNRGRSILGDLLEKVNEDPRRRVVFVSATVASQAYEVWDRSSRCQTSLEFEQQLRTDKALHESFLDCVVPLTKGNFEAAFRFFKSFRLVPLGEDELQHQLSQTVRLLLYRPDGSEVDTSEVILKIAEFVCGSLGRVLRAPEVRCELERQGYHLKDWAQDTHVRQRVGAANARYLRHVRSDLILDRPIPRQEARILAEVLQSESSNMVHLLIGKAGLGKSCVLTQTLEALHQAEVPCLVIRLDNLPPLRTSKALGNELLLPDSPALVLAGLAGGKKAVLMLDQLDAVSVVSGRHVDLFELVEELLEEARHHPSLRLLLACREFDLRNDPRISRLTAQGNATQLHNLELLTIAAVREAVAECGGHVDELSFEELEMLRVPLHLRLFSQGEPTNPTSFRNRHELFARFWKAKSAKAAQTGVQFERVMNLLSAALSREESISVRVEKLDEVTPDAEALVSENVLIRENGRYRFFHESFFDYSFARRFVGEGGDLVEFLLRDEQRLFRRTQVRQILVYERESGSETYLTHLEGLLKHPGIRLHVKKLVLEWLAQLNDPTLGEWQLVRPLLKEPGLRWGALDVLWGKVPWFDLLHRNGILSSMLSDTDNAFVDRCLRALWQKSTLRQRSAGLAELLRKYWASGPLWNNRLQALFQFGDFHRSREIFELALDLQRQGLFDEENTLQWEALNQMAEEAPEFAAEFIASTLNRKILRIRALNEVDFSQTEASTALTDWTRSKRWIDPYFINTAAEKGPQAFARWIVPIIQSLVLDNAAPAACGGFHDTIWLCICGGTYQDVGQSLLGSARRALRSLAGLDPLGCDQLIANWEGLNHKTLRFLLLSAWLGNPEYFAERAARFFVAEPLPLHVGYDLALGDETVGSGISLELLAAISPLLSAKAHSDLENAIFHYATPYERDKPQYRGYQELTLLSHLCARRLTDRGKQRIEELQRKFPGWTQSNREERVSRVGSRGFGREIPDEAFQKMKVEHFVRLFRQYHLPQPGRNNFSRDPHDLFSSLKKAASANRQRFAELILQLPDDIDSTYFDGILSGLAEDSPEADRAECGDKDVPFATEVLMEVVERTHRLSGKPCGKAICTVANTIAKRQMVPARLIQIVIDYASHPDPRSDHWTHASGTGQKNWGEDPLLAGINSVRGSAAYTFNRFLFAHPNTAEPLLAAVRMVLKDNCLSVRAAGIEALTALLNTHRALAVSLFIETLQATPVLWSVLTVEHFLYEAAITHCSSLMSLLVEMLRGPDAKARRSSARQIVLAAFTHEEARSILPVVLCGDVECRRGAAEIYASNVHHESARQAILPHLIAFFEDADKEVRAEAADWIRQKEGPWRDWERAVLGKFLESASFLENARDYLSVFERSHSPLPPEFLDMAKKGIGCFETGDLGSSSQIVQFSGFDLYLPALVVRYYQQARETEDHKTCLDLFDRMIALGWGEASRELSKTDR